MKTPLLDGIAREAKKGIIPMGYIITHRFTDTKGNNEGIRVKHFLIDASLGNDFDISLEDALELKKNGEVLFTVKFTLEGMKFGDYIEPFPLNGKIWMRTRRNKDLGDNINHLPDLGRLPKQS